MVILGAGLTGLSAAFHGRGTVFEKEKEIAGTCRSVRGEGFTFDLGIHVLHSANPYILNLLLRNNTAGLVNRRRSAWIYSRDTLTKYPFQANTFGLSKKIRQECVSGFADALRKPDRIFDNYEDWIYGVFGKGIAKHFYLPYSEKFWTVKTRELTTNWMDARVPRPRLEQVIAGAASIQKEEFGPNALFRYPKSGGIRRIAGILINKNTKILLGKEAQRIDIAAKKVYFVDGTDISYDNLVSTVPLTVLCRMFNRAPKEVIDAACGLRHNSVLCVNLGVRREDISPHHWIYFPEDKFAPFRVSFPANFAKSMAPKGWSSIQAEISYSRMKPLKYRDVVEKVINDLIRARIIKPKDKVRLINTKDIQYAYVIYDHDRLRNLDIIRAYLRKYNIYSAGRYGRWEYLWMDDAILSGKNVLKEIRARK